MLMSATRHTETPDVGRTAPAEEADEDDKNGEGAAAVDRGNRLDRCPFRVVLDWFRDEGICSRCDRIVNVAVRRKTDAFSKNEERGGKESTRDSWLESSRGRSGIAAKAWL